MVFIAAQLTAFFQACNEDLLDSVGDVQASTVDVQACHGCVQSCSGMSIRLVSTGCVQASSTGNVQESILCVHVCMGDVQQVHAGDVQDSSEDVQASTGCPHAFTRNAHASIEVSRVC